jgi:thiosulfate/3-mercaptopyruvate sulfurtransferase
VSDAVISAAALLERLAAALERPAAALERPAAVRLERPAPTLLDVRWTLGGPSGHADYLAGHLPGAVFIDLDRELAATPGAGGRHPLPDPAAFGTAMRRASVSAARPVVVYAGRMPGPAARAWWLLRYFGHPDVAVLDGGIDAWVAAGGRLEAGEVTSATPGDFVPRAGGMPLVDATSAAQLAEHGLLLDARTPERFRGESEPIDPVAGHIPGARNLPVAQTIDAEGRLVEPSALMARFEELGSVAEIGAYCGSGVTAAHTVLALAHAGRPAALYVGSWSDWITDPDRPVARGE